MVTRRELDELPLDEKIRKLRELQERAKKEIEEAKQLQDEFEDQLVEEKKLEGIEVPEAKPVDISKLFFTSEGLEASAEVEQVPDKDFMIDYNSGLEDINIGGMSHYVTFEPVFDKIEDLISRPKYMAQDKLDEATASKSTDEKVRKYSKG